MKGIKKIAETTAVADILPNVLALITKQGEN